MAAFVQPTSIMAGDFNSVGNIALDTCHLTYNNTDADIHAYKYQYRKQPHSLNDDTTRLTL
eukprot:2575221-Pleurochrysis_carterae.AAC.1